MIVDDIECNRELLEKILKPYYELFTACDGVQAYQIIKENHSKLSCVILNLLMPVMDGFQLLENLRSCRYLDEISVIIASEDDGNSELRALHLGADSFVSKPYHAEMLLHHVKKAVNEREFRLLREQMKEQPEKVVRLR